MAAAADTATESDFLSLINATRSSNGLGSLAVDGSLRSHAREHTQFMMDGKCADGANICHSTTAELKAAAGSGWTQVGENVGRGNTPSSLHQAFMNSPGHRANILGEYNYVGIGTGTKDGVLYVTVVFMQKGSTSTTTTTTAPPETTTTQSPTKTTESAPKTQSEPATTTTTVPRTTTTTTTVPPTTTTTTTVPPTTTTTTLMVGPDKPVTPGESCVEATRFWWMCHD